METLAVSGKTASPPGLGVTDICIADTDLYKRKRHTGQHKYPVSQVIDPFCQLSQASFVEPRIALDPVSPMAVCPGLAILAIIFTPHRIPADQLRTERSGLAVRSLSGTPGVPAPRGVDGERELRGGEQGGDGRVGRVELEVRIG